MSEYSLQQRQHSCHNVWIQSATETTLMS